MNHTLLTDVNTAKTVRMWTKAGRTSKGIYYKKSTVTTRTGITSPNMFRNLPPNFVRAFSRAHTRATQACAHM